MRTAYVVRRPVVNAYLVRERDRRRLRELAQVLAVVLPLAVLVLANIWVQVEVVRAGYRIDGLERQLHQLGEATRSLEVKAEELAGPATVGGRAREELGMAPAQADQLLFPGDLE